MIMRPALKNLSSWMVLAGIACFLAARIPAAAADGGSAKAPTKATQAPARTPDVVYVPTPDAVVDKMLEMAEVKPGDVVYDLGCGDGRIMVAAARKYGVKAIGFDIDPERVKEAQENIRTNHVGRLASVKEADIFTLDLSKATVVTLYLLPDLNVKLMPQLARLRPGSRIVSHDFDMRGAKPVQTVNMEAPSADLDLPDHTIYKWVVPWEKEATGEK